MESWAFTVVYNDNTLTHDEYEQKYDEIMKFWQKNGVKITTFTYEDQTKDHKPTKLHIHGQCEIGRGVYRKKLMMDGYHIKLKAWYSKGWTEYSKKNVVKVNLFKQTKH